MCLVLYIRLSGSFCFSPLFLLFILSPSLSSPPPPADCVVPICFHPCRCFSPQVLTSHSLHIYLPLYPLSALPGRRSRALTHLPSEVVTGWNWAEGWGWGLLNQQSDKGLRKGPEANRPPEVSFYTDRRQNTGAGACAGVIFTSVRPRLPTHEVFRRRRESRKGRNLSAGAFREYNLPRDPESWVWRSRACA